MGETFEHRDLSESTFHDVRLRGSTFQNVNLEGVTIQDATLAGLAIRNAYIGGITIDGIRIDRLVEAERDRRDPERVRLRMSDRFDPEVVRGVLSRLAELRAVFIAQLRTAASEVLARRPAPDSWSAIEIVRHLVFAEDLYLNRWILRNDEPWNEFGLLPEFLVNRSGYAAVGRRPTDDVETVLEPWECLHGRFQKYVDDVTPEMLRQETSDIDFGQGTVGGVLQGLAQHDLLHIRDAQALVADQEGE